MNVDNFPDRFFFSGRDGRWELSGSLRFLFFFSTLRAGGWSHLERAIRPPSNGSEEIGKTSELVSGLLNGTAIILKVLFQTRAWDLQVARSRQMDERRLESIL